MPFKHCLMWTPVCCLLSSVYIPFPQVHPLPLPQEAPCMATATATHLPLPLAVQANRYTIPLKIPTTWEPGHREEGHPHSSVVTTTYILCTSCYKHCCTCMYVCNFSDVNHNIWYPALSKSILRTRQLLKSNIVCRYFMTSNEDRYQ